MAPVLFPHHKFIWPSWWGS